jgi:hypothetical protein
VVGHAGRPPLSPAPCPLSPCAAQWRRSLPSLLCPSRPPRGGGETSARPAGGTTGVADSAQRRSRRAHRWHLRGWRGARAHRAEGRELDGGDSPASLAGWRAACRSWAGCSSWRWSRQRSSRAPTALPSSSRRTPSGSPSSPLPARGAPTSPSTRHCQRRLPPPQRTPADGESAEEGRDSDGGVRR